MAKSEIRDKAVKKASKFGSGLVNAIKNPVELSNEINFKLDKILLGMYVGRTILLANMRPPDCTANGKMWYGGQLGKGAYVLTSTMDFIVVIVVSGIEDEALVEEIRGMVEEMNHKWEGTPYEVELRIE